MFELLLVVGSGAIYHVLSFFFHKALIFVAIRHFKMSFVLVRGIEVVVLIVIVERFLLLHMFDKRVIGRIVALMLLSLEIFGIPIPILLAIEISPL